MFPRKLLSVISVISHHLLPSQLVIVLLSSFLNKLECGWSLLSKERDDVCLLFNFIMFY